MILSEAFVPDARRLFHQRMRLPIADAHYAMGFAFLFQANGNSADFERALHFLDELEKVALPRFRKLLLGLSFRLGNPWWHDSARNSA